MTKSNSNNGNSPEAKDHLEILEHMTRTEMISELMIMLNEIKDEDMPTIHRLILQAMKTSSTSQ